LTRPSNFIGSFSSERTASKRVAYDAVAMFDACTLQGFNTDIRDQLAHRIQTLL
jgi:hypothetical protein